MKDIWLNIKKRIKRGTTITIKTTIDGEVVTNKTIVKIDDCPNDCEYSKICNKIVNFPCPYNNWENTDI